MLVLANPFDDATLGIALEAMPQGYDLFLALPADIEALLKAHPDPSFHKEETPATEAETDDSTAEEELSLRSVNEAESPAVGFVNGVLFEALKPPGQDL